MSKRREALRVAGWLALVSGLASLLAAALTDTVAIDYVAAYGVLLAGAGLWAVGGVALLNRYERRSAARQVALSTVPNRQTS
jgi:hypothetical protein